MGVGRRGETVSELWEGDSANAGASDVRVHSSGPLAKLSSLRAHFLPLMTWCGEKDGRRCGKERRAPWDSPVDCGVSGEHSQMPPVRFVKPLEIDLQ